jgi:hypothetical protein
VIYHGKVISPNGQVYYCEHNHRTQTAAITCANSSRTRQMAAMEWNRAAIRAAQAAALAKQRAEERAAAQARRIEAQHAAAARRAAEQAAAEEAKAAKRAAKLAAMPPQRAWKRMTPEERLLKIAEAELGFYGEIVSADARTAYEARAGKRADANPPAPSGSAPPETAAPRRASGAGDIHAYLHPSPAEREQPQAGRKPARLKPSMRGGNAAPGIRVGRPAAPSAPAPKPPARKTEAERAAAGRAAVRELHAELMDHGIKPGSYQWRQADRELQETHADLIAHGIEPGDPRWAQAERDLRQRIRQAGIASAASTGPRVSVPAALAEDAPRATTGSPAAVPVGGFSGDGLFVVGLDITPGVYRTVGPAGRLSQWLHRSAEVDEHPRHHGKPDCRWAGNDHRGARCEGGGGQQMPTVVSARRQP